MRKASMIMGLCALLALATVSCKKNTESGSVSFKASFTNPTFGGKNYLDGNVLKWNNGDKIRVFVSNGNSAIFETSDEGESLATFSGTIEESDRYVAFYPARSCTPAEGGKVTMTLAANQTYKENGFANDFFPLAAVAENNQFNLKFRSPCNLFCLQLYGNATIKKIELEDNFITYKEVFGHQIPVQHPLAGNLVATVEDFNPDRPEFELPMEFREPTLTLDCSKVDGGGVLLSTDSSNPTKFCFVIPNYPEDYLDNEYVQFQVFQKGFTAKIYTTDGKTATLGTNEDNHIDNVDGMGQNVVLMMPVQEVIPVDPN